MPKADIVISGTGVEDNHCYIDNNDGVITLVPLAKQCFIDGTAVAAPTRLAQGKGPMKFEFLSYKLLYAILS